MSTDSRSEIVPKGHSIQLGIKRLIDILLCILVLLVGWPLFILLAVLVKLSSPGPIFFVQDRVGLGGRVFKMYKFRTMTVRSANQQQADVWTRDDELRVTWVGSIMRDYGIDELPQVFNILKGDMSIIGPRPPIPIVASKYTTEEREVFSMRPGVLSLAAIKGRRSIPMDKRIEYHLEYVKTWSLYLDWIILWRSLLVVLRRQNAVELPSTNPTPYGRDS